MSAAPQPHSAPAARPSRRSSRTKPAAFPYTPDEVRTLVTRRTPRITGRLTKIQIPLPPDLITQLDQYERLQLTEHGVSVVRKTLATEAIRAYAATLDTDTPSVALGEWLYPAETFQTTITHLTVSIPWELNTRIKTLRLDSQIEFPGITQQALTAAILRWFLANAVGPSSTDDPPPQPA